VLSGIGLCDELLTRPEESYRLCCVVVCDVETSRVGVPYIQGVSKRVLQLRKRIEIYTEDIHKVLNCQNVAKHTEFYLG
jgi:hypothetical protein